MLTTIGARSDQPRRNTVGYFANGDNAWNIVGPLAAQPGIQAGSSIWPSILTRCRLRSAAAPCLEQPNHELDGTGFDPDKLVRQGPGQAETSKLLRMDGGRGPDPLRRTSENGGYLPRWSSSEWTSA